MASKRTREQDAERALADAVHKAGVTLHRAEFILRSAREAGFSVVGLKVRIPDDQGGDYFVVVTADSPDGPLVAFHSGESLQAAVCGVLRKLENRSMRWRDDEYRSS